MKLIVCGEDDSLSLGNQIRQTAEAKAKDSLPLPRLPEYKALSLKTAKTEKDYQEMFASLVWSQSDVKTSFEVPRKPGLFGICIAKLKNAVWKLLHYRIARITDQHNSIHELLAIALKTESEIHRKEIDALNKRVSELEKSMKPDTIQ